MPTALCFPSEPLTNICFRTSCMSWDTAQSIILSWTHTLRRQQLSTRLLLAFTVAPRHSIRMEKLTSAPPPHPPSSRARKLPGSNKLIVFVSYTSLGLWFPRMPILLGKQHRACWHFCKTPEQQSREAHFANQVDLSHTKETLSELKVKSGFHCGLTL